MSVLPDHLAPGLRVVFCGTAVGTRSAAHGHYYAGRGNDFWRFLHEAGLTPRLLTPDDDQAVLGYGIGLTDLAKSVAQGSDRGLASSYNIPRFLTKIAEYRPAVVAFHGKEAGKQVSRHLQQASEVALGLQPWRLAESIAFVVPSASGTNRGTTRLEGKPSRLAWFVELRKLLDRVAP
jgi:TDG/mug DNA glycosylase family protein